MNFKYLLLSVLYLLMSLPSYCQVEYNNEYYSEKYKQSSHSKIILQTDKVFIYEVKIGFSRHYCLGSYKIDHDTILLIPFPDRTIESSYIIDFQETQNGENFVITFVGLDFMSSRIYGEFGLFSDSIVNGIAGVPFTIYSDNRVINATSNESGKFTDSEIGRVDSISINKLYGVLNWTIVPKNPQNNFFTVRYHSKFSTIINTVSKNWIRMEEQKWLFSDSIIENPETHVIYKISK